jgi:hypothetical protein
VSYSTVYDVRVRYTMDDRAGKATSKMVGQTKALGAEVEKTRKGYLGLGAAVVSAFGARMAGKALIGFNSTVEDTKNQIAGMLALTKKTDLSAELGNADRLFGNLQKRANTLPGTTMEYARMAGMLTQPIIDAGLGMKDLEDLTINSVVGAKALGVEWQAAARDVDQALRGQYHSVDVFTGKLLGSIGYKGEEGRAKFNAMGADKRAAELKRALTQKQLTQLAAAQGQTFSGALSTLQDSLEQFVGKIGVPLFKAITAELKNWNQWIDQNTDKVDAIAKSIGQGLVDGFTFVKDTLSFLVSHADLFITIGKVWAGVKLGGMLGSGIASIGGGAAGRAGGFLDFFRGASDRFNKDTGEYEFDKGGRGRQKVGLGNIGENLGMLGGSLGVGYALGRVMGLDKLGSSIATRLALFTGRTDAATVAFEKLEKQSNALEASIARQNALHKNSPQVINNLRGVAADYGQRANLVNDVTEAYKAMSAGDAGSIANYLEKKRAAEDAGISMADVMGAGGPAAYISNMNQMAGMITSRQQAVGGIGGIALEVGIRQLTEYQRQTLDVEKAQQEVLAYMTQQIAKGEAFSPATVMEILRNATNDPGGKHKATADKPKVNVTIQRIEVQSDDPDRMAFGLVSAFRDAAKNPSAAISAMREG